MKRFPLRLRQLLAIVFVLLATPFVSIPADRRDQGTEDAVYGLWLMGQSLCEGAESLPQVTPKDSGWGNLSFKRGVRTWIMGDHGDKPEERPDEQFALVPLRAKKYGGLGETIANGLADHLKATSNSVQEDKTKAAAAEPYFLTSYAGQGGRFIDELSAKDQSTDPRTPASRQHGGGYYRTSLDDARRAQKQAVAMGKDFVIAALVWMQGEANGGPRGGIVPSRWEKEMPRPLGQQWYRDRLIDYRKQWSDDLTHITRQNRELPMFTYQTLGPAGVAQLMAADQDPMITMVGPHYMVASGINSRYAGRYGAAIHLSADGERWYGEQVAKVIRRVLTEKEDWQPLRPRKARVNPARTSIVVNFQVPRPPLYLDNKFLPRQQYQNGNGFSSLCGFKIQSTSGELAMITSVEVESPDSIRIRLAVPLKTGKPYTISYGLPYSGQIGKIASIRKGPSLADQPSTEIVIAGSLNKQLKALIAEGAFYAANTLTGDAFTQAPIRHVYEDHASTILRFENRELRNEVKFVAGQNLISRRPFSYGNLRDSDPETSTYHFSDPAYGNRTGQAYPLWNWCILFKNFPIVAWASSP